MLLGCIADDLTGATDLSLMLSREGLRTVQTTGVPTQPLELSNVDAVVVALKSRTIPADQAVSRCLAAAEWLLTNGAQRLFFKYCSTFDSTDLGNIGPVTEALLNLLSETFTIACPAFPAAGRSIYQGNLFVNGGAVGDRVCQFAEQPLRFIEVARRSFECDPIFAGGDSYTEGFFDEPKIAGFVGVQRLRLAGVVKMQSLASHVSAPTLP